MATATQIWKDFGAAIRLGDIRRAWRALDRIPDCPQCKGSGEPINGFSETVFWRGREVEVCATCKGAGKV